MPSLDEILKDTLIMAGAAGNPAGLTEFEPGINTFANRPSPDPARGPLAQPIWTWDYSGLREINQAMPMNRVENLEVWSRTIAGLHGVDQGWMTVAMPVEWAPVAVTLPQERVVLPLTQKYFAKGFMLSSASYPGTNAWWPLAADLDQSFASVFLYDLTSRQPNQPPATVDAAHFNSPDFMPAPNVESGNLPVGSTGDTEDRHFICVVLSLVCMQERADFEPGGIVGMGRFYPHFMIMSNKRMPRVMTIANQQFSTGIEATIRVTRPDRSGYYGSFANPGGAPRIMQHPDMDPVVMPLLITEPNETRGMDPLNLVSVPYWDLFFDYFLPLDYRGGAPNLLARNQLSRVVDRGMAGRRELKGVLQHLDYTKLLNLVTVALTNPTVFPQLPAPLRVLGIEISKIALSRPSLQAVMFGNVLSALQLATVSQSNFLPRIKKRLIKLPGQGTFDNLHLAPRMKAHTVIGTPEMNNPKWQSSLDTFDTLRMAPFCEHDCMHTHWRWGLAFKGAPNEKPIRGFAASASAAFAGTGAPYQTVGNAMVPLNQDVDIGFGSNSQLSYTASLTDIAPGVWQPVYHHGSAYVLGFSASGALLHPAIKVAIGNSSEDSELYWNMRYQATVDGALERVVLDPFDLHRAIMASNTVRIHTRVLEEPENVRIEVMLANAKALLKEHNIDLVEASRETFIGTDDEIVRFNTLAVNDEVPTDDQTALFGFRGEVEPDELLIYFVRTLVPAQAGCAAHPPDRPGVIVAVSLASEWTLAHQIGHVLGLEHVDVADNLMTRRSTETIEAPIPDLTAEQASMLLQSPFIKV
jgi:hypothetical protein